MPVICEFRATLLESDDARYTVPSGGSVAAGEVVELDGTGTKIIAVAAVGGDAYETIAVYTRIPRLKIPLTVPTAGLSSGRRVYWTGTAFTLTASTNKLVGTIWEDANVGDEVIIDFNGRGIPT